MVLEATQHNGGIAQMGGILRLLEELQLQRDYVVLATGGTAAGGDLSLTLFPSAQA